MDPALVGETGPTVTAVHQRALLSFSLIRVMVLLNALSLKRPPPFFLLPQPLSHNLKTQETSFLDPILESLSAFYPYFMIGLLKI